MDKKLGKVFEAKQNLMDTLGWDENPFVKDLRLENKEEFLKYYCPLESAGMLKKLAFDTKACILLGPKGVGKTSALHYVMYSLPHGEFITYAFKQPPESLDELALEIGIGTHGILHKIRSLLAPKKPKGLSRHQIAAKIRSMDRKVVFFVDEAHLLSNKDMYMELKYLLDEVPNLRLVLCALGKDTFPDSLMQIVGEGNIFTRNKFSAAEMKEIIGHRIDAVGGHGLEPFSDDYLSKVLTEQNLLTPRYVFDELNNYLADLAMDEDRMAELSKRMSAYSRKDAQGKPKVVETRESARKDDSSKDETREKKPTIIAQKAEKNDQSEGQSELERKYAHDPLISTVIAEGKYQRVQNTTPNDIVSDEDEIIDGDIAAREEKIERLVGERPIVVKNPKSLNFLTTMHAEWWVQLSPSQQQIMGMLVSSNAGFTLAQIMDSTGLTQNTAFNALYQLRGDDSAEIARKPEVPFPLINVKKQVVGNKKRNIYFANEKIRNLFTMT